MPQKKINKIAALLCAIAVVLVVSFLAWFLFNARELGYVDSAIGSLRILSNAAQQYATAHPEEGFPRSLEEMYAAGLIDDTLRYGLKNRYRYVYVPRVSGVNQPVKSYEIRAYSPDFWPKRLYFYMDESGLIRFSDAGPANKNSAPM